MPRFLSTSAFEEQHLIQYTTFRPLQQVRVLIEEHAICDNQNKLNTIITLNCLTDSKF